jgi:hypothetical protein
MPDNHKQFVKWSGDRFRKWAASIGPSTETVVSGILEGFKVEQQGYRSCTAMLKLADTFTPQRLESACERALTITSRPTYKAIQTILKSGSDRFPDEAPPPSDSSEFGFVRGAEYYGQGGRS